MPNDLTPPDPARFDLQSFADLLPARAPILGEDPGSFEGFRAGMMQSLLPMTPYEGVIAENLIAIEWKLLQHRRMRDAGLRKVVRNHVIEAVVTREEAVHDAELDDAWEAHEAAAEQTTTGNSRFLSTRTLHGRRPRPRKKGRVAGPGIFQAACSTSKTWVSMWLN